MLNALYLELNGAFYKKLTAYKQRESRMRIFFIATATIFHVIAYIVIIRGGLRGDYPIGTMGLLSIAMVNIRSSLREASDIIDDLYQFKTQIDAFVKYLKKRSIDDSKASMEIADNKGTTLSVENVNFWYPVEKRVEIKYSDLTINTPGIIGINAKNGAGKTTLLHLITGDYPSKEGCIKFCNQDISQFSLSSYHRYLATLMQGDSILSSITIKELIIQGQKYDNDTFWRVVETVGLTEKIQNLTLKEDTLCGSEYEHGTGFSGGQNQRLLFARLLYKLATSPVRLVLLDEPTAFFDANMRKLFFKILREFLPENSITILVTHSSAELKKCDRILKLK